jgi:thiamine pyrophosphokinase
LRAVIFANGLLSHPKSAKSHIRPDDWLIAADGGARNCKSLGLQPEIVIGDFDSLTKVEIEELRQSGSVLIEHPARKDFTDLELAIRYAVENQASEILILGGLGARWDQSLANLLMAAHRDLVHLPITLVDGRQEIHIVHSAGRLEISGTAGDIVSLIPLTTNALGITTQGLEYPLKNEDLFFGATRGISNELKYEKAQINMQQGTLLVTHIRSAESEKGKYET